MIRTMIQNSLVFLFLFLAPTSLLALEAVPVNIINAQCLVTPEEESDADLTLKYQDKTYAVCCRKCLRKLRADPESYITAFYAEQQKANKASHVQSTEEGGSENIVIESTDIQTSAEHDEVLTQGEGAHQHSASAADHDHSAHGIGIIGWIGKFHIVIIHFPIALIVLAASCALYHKKWPRPHLQAMALLCTHIAMLSAVVATALGWATWTQAAYPGSETILLFHQYLGTATALICIVASIAAGRSLEQARHPRIWFYTIILGAILVSITGHFGGALVYGSDYFF